MRLTQPGTMLVSPLSQEGFTSSGIYVAHAKNNHFVKPCLSFVIKHVTAHDQAWPWNLAGDVVLHRQNALVELCGPSHDPQHMLCDANARAVLENHPASSHRSGGPMRLRPLFNQVVLQLDSVESEAKVDGWGIAIPETAQELPCKGTVVAIGPEVTAAVKHASAYNLKLQDRVAFLKFSGSTLKIDGVEYLVVKENAILAILDPETPQAEPAFAGEGHGMALHTHE